MNDQQIKEAAEKTFTEHENHFAAKRIGFIAGAQHWQEQGGPKWVKAINNGFPSTKGKYFFRKPSQIEDWPYIKWVSFIVPHAIDKELWIKEKWEWLDESGAGNDDKDGWIRTDDIRNLPEDNETVLWIKIPVVEPPVVASICDEGFYYVEYTHWMPLPEPPQ